MILVLLVGLFLIDTCEAVVPGCAVLLECNVTSFSTLWVQSAMTEALWNYQLLLGAFLLDGTLVNGCFEDLSTLDSSFTIVPDPETCASARCDFEQIPELNDPTSPESCAGMGVPTATEANAAAPSPGPAPAGGVTRSARQWFSIGIKYLEYSMYSLKHDPTQMGDQSSPASAVSYACAAELMLRMVRMHLQQANPTSLDQLFLTGEYVHQYTDLFSLQFGATIGVVTPGVIMRTVQSFRRQLGTPDTKHHLTATWSFYEIEDLVMPVRGGVISQLLWPLTGVVASFGHTHLPISNQCSELDKQSNLNGVVQQSDYKFRDLGQNDIAVVIDTFVRCDEFPRAGCVTRYNLLRQSLVSGTLVLNANIQAPYLIPSAVAPNVTSFSYITHRFSTITIENPPSAPLNSNKLVIRTATTSVCNDDISSSIGTLSTGYVASYRKPLPGVPLTLAVGQSVCVGGEHAGQNCTMQNDCGEQMACRKKPMSKNRNGYCFDGKGWNMAMPCDLPPVGHTTCPYGHCYGQIDGHSGGAYPKLQAWNEAGCDHKKTPDASGVCSQPWYLHPSVDSVASI